MSDTDTQDQLGELATELTDLVDTFKAHVNAVTGSLSDAEGKVSSAQSEATDAEDGCEIDHDEIARVIVEEIRLDSVRADARRAREYCDDATTSLSDLHQEVASAQATVEEIIALAGRIIEEARSPTLSFSVSDAQHAATFEKAVDAAVAAKLAKTGDGPKVGKAEYKGIAINVRYGFAVGEDEDLGPTLRCDVNADGYWLLARQSGRSLGRLLRDHNISDTAWIENKEVLVAWDKELGYRLTKVYTDEESAEMLAAEQKAKTVEVGGTRYPIGTRFTTTEGWIVTAVDESTSLKCSDKVKDNTGVKVRVIELPPGGVCNVGDVMRYSVKGLGTAITPLAEDTSGNPVYSGDRVQLTVPDAGTIKGTLHSGDDGRIGLLRDDGVQGGGPWIDGTGTWAIGNPESVELLESKLARIKVGEDAKTGVDVYVDDTVVVEQGGGPKVGKLVVLDWADEGDFSQDGDYRYDVGLKRDDGIAGGGPKGEYLLKIDSPMTIVAMTKAD